MIGVADPKFNLVPCLPTESSEWDAFVDQSPQGHLFCKESFLKTVESGSRQLWIRHGTVTVGALCFDVNPQGDAAGNDELMYSGLMFSPDVSADTASARNKRFEITEFIAAWLAENFSTVSLRLSPHFEDVRPFSWHNYHAPSPAFRYQVAVEYTSYIKIEDLDLASEKPVPFFEQLHPLRRRSLRAARRDGARTAVEPDAGLLAEAYAALMHKQRISFDGRSTATLARRIEDLLKAGDTLQFITYDHKDVAVYTAVFGWDSKRAYYLYGAPTGQARTAYQGTFCFLSAFETLAARGQRVVDLEGVNSPRRGWFKLSLGGSLLPLFYVRSRLA